MARLFTKEKVRRAIKRALILDVVLSVLYTLLIMAFFSISIQSTSSPTEYDASTISWEQFLTNLDTGRYNQIDLKPDLAYGQLSEGGTWEKADLPEDITADNYRSRMNVDGIPVSIVYPPSSMNMAPAVAVANLFAMVIIFIIFFIPLFAITLAIEWYCGLSEQ